SEETTADLDGPPDGRRLDDNKLPIIFVNWCRISTVYSHNRAIALNDVTVHSASLVRNMMHPHERPPT
ncbi:hypothetical protein, partial [Nocardia sp. NPDC055049]